MTRRTFTPCPRNAVQLDIDRADDLQHFYRCLPWLSCIAAEHGWPIRAMSYAHSRSGRWHITVTFPRRLTRMEQIALQAILGSDRARELCNWERIHCRSSHPILFANRRNRKVDLIGVRPRRDR